MNNVFVITLSPAIDYILNFEHLDIGKTNRPIKTDMYPAGKGIHISMLLNNLDIKNESIIFIGGKFQDYFESELLKSGINYKTFQAQGNIRINLKLIDEHQTECSALAPRITEQELVKLFAYLNRNVKQNDIVVLTGSIPDNVNSNIYKEIAKIVNKLNAKCIVDSYGVPLQLACTEKLLLIKPNEDELAITVNQKISSIKEIINAAKTLLSPNVEYVLVSRGKNGALLVTNNFALNCPIIKSNYSLVNAAGAGDSLLAGFISSYLNNKDLEYALKVAVICGSATAYSQRIASRELLNELLNDIDKLQIERIEW